MSWRRDRLDVGGTDHRRVDDRFRRGPLDTAGAVGRWALVTVVEPVRLLAHRLWWTASRRLDDVELELPDLARPYPGDEDGVLRAADGAGPLHVRRYRLRVASDAAVADGMAVLRDDIDSLVPGRFVRFRAADGGPVDGPLTVGQEFVARITGPQDGPVRVIGLDEGELRLATLNGHVEAGEIAFRVRDAGPGRLVVEVQSWARSGGEAIRVLYERGGGQEVQSHVWTSLTLALAERLDGRPVGRVEVADRAMAWPVTA